MGVDPISRNCIGSRSYDLDQQFFPWAAGSYICVLSTSGTWQSTWQVALVKLTCPPRLWPLFKSLDKWQLVKSTCRVNLKGDHPKITSASCPKNPPRGVLGGGSLFFCFRIHTASAPITSGTHTNGGAVMIVRSQSWPKQRSKSITF